VVVASIDVLAMLLIAVMWAFSSAGPGKVTGKLVAMLLRLSNVFEKGRC
jgi:hypothetical protein